MRMRKKKHQDTRLAACGDLLVPEPQAQKGRWHALSGGRPIHLEIGCGKGRFITETARLSPHIYHLAVERVPSVLLLALEKAKAEQIENLRFLSVDAAVLADLFAPGEIACIYLNFSDPWPPKRHWKRRLTHPNMLAVYDRFLAPGGHIIQKTDNSGLFEFSLCQFSQFGYTLDSVSLDLHQTDLPNVMTEYEEAFSSKGVAIKRLVAVKPE